MFTDFSLNIEGNKIYGLLGKNGTGKSTLLYLMSGLMRAGKGSISIDGINSQERNPLLLVIPCHRVVGADGSLTGYAGGLAAKERLLALEQARRKM